MWKPTTTTIASIPCLQHKVTKELAAFGTRGQLFEFAAGDVRALIYHEGYEEVKRVPIKQVKRWAVKLQIPTDLKEQIELSKEGPSTL